MAKKAWERYEVTYRWAGGYSRVRIVTGAELAAYVEDSPWLKEYSLEMQFEQWGGEHLVFNAENNAPSSVTYKKL